MDKTTRDKIDRNYEWFISVEGFGIVNDTFYPSEQAAIDRINSFDELANAKAKAKERLVSQINDHTNSLYATYPKIEQDTFPYQRKEIEAWEVDNNSPTPVIDSIATGKGVGREAQLQRVQNKVNQFKITSNSLTAQRQALSDFIDTATDVNTINSVNFEA